MPLTESKCSRCSRHIFSFQRRCVESGLCQACMSLSEPGELDHSSELRCPACKHSWDLFDCGDYGEMMDEDGHDIDCPECQHEFRIVTSISFIFTSPAIGNLKSREDD